jgi:excisionase family DNA binding protein
MPPDLLSITQVAERLSVTEAAVRKWLAQRRLPVVKLGRLTRLRACDLEDVVKHGLPAPGTHPRTSRDHWARRNPLTCVEHIC